MYNLGYLGGPEGVFNNRTGPSLLSSYPPTQDSCPGLKCNASILLLPDTRGTYISINN